MAALRDLFAKLYAYVLLFEQTEFDEETQPSYEQVHGEITTLLEEQKAAARNQQLDRDYQEALFAFVAWADETILKHKTWQHRQRWNNQLQNEYFQTRNAGRELFEKLGELPAEQKDIREIYYTSLGLGFSGQYFRGQADALKLEQIRHEQAQHLPVPTENLQDIDKLTPQPYSVERLKGSPIKPPLTQLLLKIGLVMLIVVPLVLLVYYYAKRDTTPPLPPPPPIEEEVSTRLANVLDCAVVVVDAFDEKTGVIRLTGRVPHEAERTKIHGIVQNIERVKAVKDTFDTIPRPFCEVLEILEPIQAVTPAASVGLSMRLNEAGDPATYVRGNNLVVDITSPTAFDSHVYVDYYTADGWVGHMFPNPQEQGNVLRKGSTYTVGRLDGPQPWLISPPFGLELVTVIATKTPLFSPSRLQPEEAKPYIQVLRQVLDKDKIVPSEVVTTFHFIVTRDQ